MTQAKPTIGRIVHYTNLGDKDGKYPPEIQAALITGVYGEFGPANEIGAKSDSHLVDLTVFYRTGYFQMKACPFSEEPKRGCWNWPTRD